MKTIYEKTMKIAKEWIVTPEGRKAMKEALKQIEESERELREKRRITPEDLMRVWGAEPNVG